MRKSTKLLGFAAAAAASLAFVSSANAVSIGTTATSWSLNTNDASNDGFVGPASTTTTLSNNASYVVTATGTWSNWGATLWDYGKVCGTPTAAPLTPSPLITNYKAGIDPEFVYAFARGRRYDCTTLTTPKAHTKFKFELTGSSTVSNFTHYTAGPSPTTPTASHGYTYYLRTGSSSNNDPFSFGFEDPHASDNYGVINGTIRRATSSDCGNGQWAYFRNTNGTQTYSSQTNCQFNI